MGTWGTGPFDSDAALDLLGDLQRADDVRAAVVEQLTDAADATLDGWDGNEL